eukprot:scaffold38776_cov15-Tisochrysis_lutea.AAC.4
MSHICHKQHELSASSTSRFVPHIMSYTDQHVKHIKACPTCHELSTRSAEISSSCASQLIPHVMGSGGQRLTTRTRSSLQFALGLCSRTRQVWLLHTLPEHGISPRLNATVHRHQWISALHLQN